MIRGTITHMKKTIITTVIVIIAIIIIYLVVKSPAKTTLTDETPAATSTIQSSSSSSQNTTNATSTRDSTLPSTNGAVTVIGRSVGGRDVNAYHYMSTSLSGTGTTELLFVGGIHGGYAWNTALVAYELMDYLMANPSAIPANVRVTVIPVLNPDGLKQVAGTTTGNFTAADVSSNKAIVEAGRFNGNNVDLNRNFDCDWQATGKWQSRTVSGGDVAFSEPESLALKNYVESSKPTAVIAWYSAAGGVYASNCHNGVSTETNDLVRKYAAASGYSANESFDFYVTTGDMTNWLAKISIPAIGVLLSNHSDTEWSKNLAGVQALFKYYAK